MVMSVWIIGSLSYKMTTASSYKQPKNSVVIVNVNPN